MTFKRTIIISIFCHSLVVCVALLCIRNIPMHERTILVEIRTPVVEDDAGKGDVQRASRVEAAAKSPTSAPGKKVSPPPLNETKRNDNRPDEPAKGKGEEPGPAGTMPVPLPAPPDAVQADGKGAGQGGAGLGAEGVSIYMNGNGGGSPGSSSGSGSGEGNETGRIREAIERAKVYPELARKRRQEGIVVTEFSINPHGLPENIRVTKSSGFSLLDSAARNTIIKAAPFPVVKGRIEVPINFILE